MDRMQFYEMECLLENMWRKNKESWEQARTMAYVTAQSQSTKKLDMQGMMEFPWEKTDKVEETEESKEDILRKMKEMEKILNKK